MPDEYTTSDALLASYAWASFKSVELETPALARHPLWKVAMGQLVALEKRLHAPRILPPERSQDSTRPRMSAPSGL